MRLAESNELRPAGILSHMTELLTNADVDTYVASLTNWRAEFEALRPLLLAAGLTEEIKWRKPCYTHGGGNIAIFQPFKEFCAVMFFKGALLDDPHGALREQGEHSRSALRFEFRSVADITDAKPALAHLLADAKRVEDEGLKVEPAPTPAPMQYPDELVELMEADEALRAAFERLTPGRQRGWLLHFSSAKQSATRTARIERAYDRILEGFGMHD